MRIAIILCLAAGAAVALYLAVDLSRLGAWAVEQQRAFQNQMASAIRALKSGDPGAYLALLAAAGAYGFVHALGPGHGKYLVGGVGLGTSVSASRLLGIAAASSLAQALWAILLVYGGFFLIEATARQMTSVAEDILAPASYLAIAGVGVAIVWRGARALAKTAPSGHQHAHGACGCHSHGPTQDEVSRIGSLREAVLLVASIAIRPCTGAIFLLVIAWQMDIKAAGAGAVVVMGLGTAALTSLVAISSIAARGIAFASSSPVGRLHVTLPALQIFAGIMIALVSLTLLRAVT